MGGTRCRIRGRNRAGTRRDDGQYRSRHAGWRCGSSRVADERAEYAGLLLAGLGARSHQILQNRPERQHQARRIGPFLEDQPGLERSLFFWNYNRNKKSVVLDLQDPRAREDLLRLLDGADVLLDASCGALNTALGLDRTALGARFPQLVSARMTPFGDDGPWADFKSSDLIHLALGGGDDGAATTPTPGHEYDAPRRSRRRSVAPPTISPASRWQPGLSPR